MLLSRLHLKLGVMKNSEGNGQEKQQVYFHPGEVLIDKHGETQGWYIWRPSNQRTHEGPNVCQSTEQSWTVHLLVTEVNSYKLPEKPTECGIWEGNWRGAEEFFLSQSMDVSQTAFSAVTLLLFSKELWKFDWRVEWALSPRHLYYGRALPSSGGCKISSWLLPVLEMGYSGCWAQEEGS